MKILIVGIFYLIVLILSSRYLFDNKQKVLYILPILLFITFDLSMTDTVLSIVGEELKFYINTLTYLLIILCLFLFNKKMFSYDISYFFFLLLALNTMYHLFIANDISSSPYFLRLTLNYFSIFLCFLIAKGISNFSVDTFLYSFNYLAIANGVLGILQIITKRKLLLGQFNMTILYTEGVVDSYRVVGVAGSNNSAGNLATLLFVISVYNLIIKKDKLSFLSTSITLYFAFLTQTRIALVAIVASSIIIYIFSDFNKKGFWKWLPYVMLVVTVVVIILFYDKFYQILFLNRGNTAGERINQFFRTKDYALFDHFWFGIGSGQWRSFLYENYEIVDIPIHSQYLNFWVENGFIIFLSFVIMNSYILIKTLMNKTINRNKKAFILAFFIGNFVVSNFNPNQIYTINNIIFYLIFFIIYNSTSLEKKKYEDIRSI